MNRRSEEISEKQFSLPDWHREDYGKVGRGYSERVSPEEMDLFVKTHTSSKRHVSLRRPRLLIGLLFVLLGFLLVTAFIFMKPEEEALQIDSQRVKRSISFIGEGEQHIKAGFRRGNGMEAKLLEWDTPEKEKPMTPGPPEPAMMVHNPGVDEGPPVVGEEGSAQTGIEGGVAGLELKMPELGGGKKGIPRVSRVEESKGRVIPESEPVKEVYTINIGSFRDKGNAERLMKEWGEKGYSLFTEKTIVSQKGIWYRVSVGRFSSREEAQSFARGLEEKGINSYFVRKRRERGIQNEAERSEVSSREVRSKR